MFAGAGQVCFVQGWSDGFKGEQRMALGLLLRLAGSLVVEFLPLPQAFQAHGTGTVELDITMEGCHRLPIQFALHAETLGNATVPGGQQGDPRLVQRGSFAEPGGAHG
ncbi:hypothetical protein D3C81_1017060 [compost metagenome]